MTFTICPSGLQPHHREYGCCCSSVQAWLASPLPRWVRRLGERSVQAGFPEIRAQRILGCREGKVLRHFSAPRIPILPGVWYPWEASSRIWESPSGPRRERNPEAWHRQAVWIAQWTSRISQSARDEAGIGNAPVPDKLRRTGEQRRLKAPGLHLLAQL